MATKKRTSSAGFSFGGDWTEKKLAVLEKYLSAYTKVLSGTPFKTAYIDAFAGAGHLARTSASGELQEEEVLFPELQEEQSQKLLAGSAKIALKTKIPFDRYVLIEKNTKRHSELKNLKSEFKTLGNRIDIRRGDANSELLDIFGHNEDWKMYRAVAFLDPFGMQVKWKTVEAIAQTRRIDLWLLFPLGIGVNRLLTRSGKIRPEHEDKLTEFFGTTDWKEELYERKFEYDLFSDEVEKVVKGTQDLIKRYFLKRLKSEFCGVYSEPGVLRNSAGNPLYLLCFAVANPNPRAQEIAFRIAGSLLKDLR